MTGLEIKLMWALIAVVIIGMVLFWAFVVAWRERKREVRELNKNLSKVTLLLIGKDAIIDSSTEVISGCRSTIKDLTDQLKQIKELREAGKEWWITVVLKTTEGKEEEETFKANRALFCIDGDTKGIVFFYDGDCEPVFAIERDNYILHKKELVDIDKPTEEK